MSEAPDTTRNNEQKAVILPRWRWYHAATFYVAVQIMTFGLSGLVSMEL